MRAVVGILGLEAANRGDFLRFALLTVLAAGIIATVMKPEAAMPGPDDPFYEGALCLHQPRKAPANAGGGT